MGNKQTAVQWLIEEIDARGLWTRELRESALQAISMEREQIEDAFNSGDCNGTFETINRKQYYTQTTKPSTMTTQELKLELEYLRQAAHNGTDVYNRIVNLQKKIEDDGIDREQWRYHAEFVDNVLEGGDPESEWGILQEKLDGTYQSNRN